MSKYTVLVTDYVFAGFEQERKILAEARAELKIAQCKTIAKLIPQVRGVHGLLNTYLAGIGPEVFDAAPNLKVGVRYGIGLDTIDIPAATFPGIMVANVPDYCINEVANHALAHFRALARKIPLSGRKVKTGEWSNAYVKTLKALAGMRAGIIGFDRIGRVLASRLKAFGVEVVDTDALVWALENGKISGAGLDVLEDDSIIKTPHPLKGCPNVTITPHSAWFSDAAIPELQRRAAQEMARALRGERPTSP